MPGQRSGSEVNCQSLNIQCSVREKKNNIINKKKQNQNNPTTTTKKVEFSWGRGRKKRRGGGREQRNSAKCSCTSGFRSPLQYRQGVAQPPCAAPRGDVVEGLSWPLRHPCPLLPSSRPGYRRRLGANTVAGDPRASHLPPKSKLPALPHVLRPTPPPAPKSAPFDFLTSNAKECCWAVRMGAPHHCHPGG